MNVLFLLPRFPENKEDSSIEKDLVMEFQKQGNNIYVAVILERYLKLKTCLVNKGGINLLKIRTGNYYKKNISFYERGFTSLILPYSFICGISHHLKDIKIDLVILSTPMMNNPYLMAKLRKYFNCRIVLIIWDIFPQNAVDIGLIKNTFLIGYFKKKYQQALNCADYVTVMSPGCKKYIQNHFKINESKLLILKNWAEIKGNSDECENVRERYSLNEDDFILVFGGNMGKPQKLENILMLAERTCAHTNIKYLFVGKGTECENLMLLANRMKLSNVIFIPHVPRYDYEYLLKACDIGIVSLDEKFTVPNFPSKTTDYFKLSLPVLASLDKTAISDYGYFLEKEAKAGIVGQAGNVEDLYHKLMVLYQNKELRNELGSNGRKYYEEYLGVDIAYQTIMNKLNN